MAGVCDFVYPCERCGKEVPYEDMQFIAEMYVCRECFAKLLGRILWLEGVIDEDDGYPD
jgi:DNA-directed RNA polymerase subunit RPC12/RpoP